MQKKRYYALVSLIPSYYVMGDLFLRKPKALEGSNACLVYYQDQSLPGCLILWPGRTSQ